MALTKKQKYELLDIYTNYTKGAKNIIILKQFGIPVNIINNIRIDINDISSRISVVKKRIFLKQIVDSGYEPINLDILDGSIIVLYSYEDEFAPIKLISKYIKQFKKSKQLYGFEYLGGWFDKSWKDADYVKTLADLPSKPELVGKFMFLLNYPIQSFVTVLDKIKEKKG